MMLRYIVSSLLVLHTTTAQETTEEVKLRVGANYLYEIGQWETIVVSGDQNKLYMNAANIDGKLTIFSAAERFSVQNGYLQIADIVDTDEGAYIIRVTISQKLNEHVINLIVLIPPVISMEVLTDVIVESDSNVDIAKCTADGGKPQAMVSWQFVNFNHDLSVLTGQEESMLSIKPNRNMNNYKVQCIVEHEAIDTPLISELTLDIQFKPGQPSMKIIDANCDDELSNKKLKLVCEDNAIAANPKVEYFEWIIPGDTEKRVTPELTVDPSKVNELSIYKCRANNKHGVSGFEEKNLSELNIAACPATSSLGIMIGIIVIVVVIILAVLIIWWRKLFCFAAKKGEPKQDYDLDSYPNVVKSGGQTYDYQPQPPKTAPPIDDESDDESDSAGQPLVSQNNQRSNGSLNTGEDDQYLDDAMDQYLDHAANRYSPDYVPPREPHYASLNKEVLGVRQSTTPIDRHPVEYASLTNQKFQMV